MHRLFVPCALVAGAALSACSSLAKVEADLAHATFPGVATIHSGKIDMNWIALEGSISRIDINSVRGPLKEASVTIFEDRNQNGQPDPGEEVKSFTASQSSDGFTLNNLRLGSGELSGRDRKLLSMQFKVVDANGNTHIHSTTL
jgi:hypothetical protein